MRYSCALFRFYKIEILNVNYLILDNKDNNIMSSVTKIINNIIWKDNWECKFNNKSILKKWREESMKIATNDEFDMAIRIIQAMLNRRMKDENGRYLSDSNIQIKGLDDYELDYDSDSGELKRVKKEKLEGTFYQSFYYDLNNELDDFLICFSDNEFKELSEKFNKEICEIERTNKFWHPGSNNKVLDIIHPSLYCYVKGLSMKNGCIEEPKKKDDINEIYQWLPSEFRVTENGVKIESYINNLDYNKYQEMYELIGNIFYKFVPNFEKLLGIKLKERCQVITKIANIKISSIDKIYEGGEWHLEGMDYENIIATGIYYYDIDNIKDSYLEFRKAVQYPLNYPQNDNYYVFHKYGLNDQDKLNKYLGKTSTNIRGKCIVFPNYIQHRVTDFKLSDENRDGTRKILVFFLIDPKKRITSTADVPIQQRSIIEECIYQNTILPKEIISEILNYTTLMTREDAEHHMKNLMLSRKYYTNDLNKDLYEREFSLCEH